MELGIELAQVIGWVRSRWYERRTPLVLTAAALLVWLWLFVGIPVQAVSGAKWLWLVPIVAITLALWWRTSRIPEATQNTVGVAVAITAETESEQAQLSRDFVQNLRTLLARPGAKYEFSVVEIPQYFARRIGKEADAKALLNAARCRFMVYGASRVRRISGVERHVLDLHGIVAHRPVPEDAHRALAAEFAEALPPRATIPTENDLFGFEITSDLVNLAARYIIGLASFLSGDVEYAQTLYEGLSASIGRFDTKIPAVRKIQERLPKRLAEVYLAHALRAYEEWRRTRSTEQLAKLGHFAGQASKVDSGNYQGHLFMGIYYFAKERSVAKARVELNKCKGNSDSVWILNDAFLVAYSGNLRVALAKYKKAFKRIPDPFAMLQAEDFICWVLETETREQLHFCLGLINYCGKHDIDSAERDFRCFLGTPAANVFPEAKAAAEQYLAQIRAERLKVGPTM